MYRAIKAESKLIYKNKMERTVFRVTLIKENNMDVFYYIKIRTKEN